MFARSCLTRPELEMGKCRMLLDFWPWRFSTFNIKTVLVEIMLVIERVFFPVARLAQLIFEQQLSRTFCRRYFGTCERTQRMTRSPFRLMHTTFLYSR